MPDANELAARLSRAVAERTAIAPLADDVPDLDLAAGYAVQRVLRERAGPLVGWKLGVTSRAKQAQVGVTSPVFGFLAGAHGLDVGEQLDTGALIQPRCEPEIVFVLGRDLAGPQVTGADVRAAASGVAVGIEVFDSRYRDYRSSPTTPRPAGSWSAPRCHRPASTCGWSAWSAIDRLGTLELAIT